MTETQALASPTTGQASVLKHLLMGKASDRTRRAYADDLQEFARLLQIEPVGWVT